MKEYPPEGGTAYFTEKEFFNGRPIRPIMKHLSFAVPAKIARLIEQEAKCLDMSVASLMRMWVHEQVADLVEKNGE